MIQHPLPPYIISTPLNQLPLASSQISSQIIKRQMEIKKFLLSNINVGLEFHQKNQKLLDSLEQSNQISLTDWKIGKQEHVLEQTIPQSKSMWDKCRSALRVSNLDELTRNFDTLPEEYQQTLALQVASQLPIPNKLNSPKIINLMIRILQSPLLKLEVKEAVLRQSFKTLIQKSLKMKLDVKSYNTNRNLKYYYFDMVQIYQKSFNKTMKILVNSVDSSLHGIISQIVTKTLNQFRINLLGLLESPRSEEKTLYFLLGLKEPLRDKDWLLHLSKNYCKNEVRPQLVKEFVGKTTCHYLLKLESDKYMKKFLENDEDGQKVIDLDIKVNLDILDFLFEEINTIESQDNGKFYNEIQKYILGH